mgnify:CR=1 FL=1
MATSVKMVLKYGFEISFKNSQSVVSSKSSIRITSSGASYPSMFSASICLFKSVDAGLPCAPVWLSGASMRDLFGDRGAFGVTREMLVKPTLLLLGEYIAYVSACYYNSMASNLCILDFPARNRHVTK